jgi:hypothetical protein
MTPRTLTEPEAWREIARRIVKENPCWHGGEWRGYGMYTLVFALYSTGAVTKATAQAMEARVASHLLSSAMQMDGTANSRALAALWLALEAEEEGV